MYLRFTNTWAVPPTLVLNWALTLDHALRKMLPRGFWGFRISFIFPISGPDWKTIKLVDYHLRAATVSIAGEKLNFGLDTQY